MTLPKLYKPTFKIQVPSLKEDAIFRPFLVKEEKILLIAQQSNDDADVLRALTQIIGNCAIDPNFDATSLATFDIEYIFLKLRAVSVNNIVELQYQDMEDDKIYKFTVDLNEVEIITDPANTNTIKVDEENGIIMKYPKASIANEITSDDPLEVVDQMILSCIDKIYTAEEVYNAIEYSREELKEFVDDLNIQTYDAIKDFFTTLPKMYYKIEYENSLGTKREIELKSLRDFFTWG